jgi:hypothetical protein
VPAQDLSVEATGEEVDGSVLLRPAHRTHHPQVTL